MGQVGKCVGQLLNSDSGGLEPNPAFIHRTRSERNRYFPGSTVVSAKPRGAPPQVIQVQERARWHEASHIGAFSRNTSAVMLSAIPGGWRSRARGWLLSVSMTMFLTPGCRHPVPGRGGSSQGTKFSLRTLGEMSLPISSFRPSHRRPRGTAVRDGDLSPNLICYRTQTS